MLHLYLSIAVLQCTPSQREISIYFYETALYRGGQKGTKGAGGGGLKSADCKPGNLGVAAGAASYGIASKYTLKLVGDPGSTNQCQSSLYLCGGVLKPSESGTWVGEEKGNGLSL